MRIAFVLALLAAWPVQAQEDQDESDHWGVTPNTDWGIKPGSDWGIKPGTNWGVAPDQEQDTHERLEAAKQSDDTSSDRLEPEDEPEDAHPKSSERSREASRGDERGRGNNELPGNGPGWVKLKGDQGWRDPDGNIWKKDKLHKDHWDITNRMGKKIREVDFDGNQIWPDGPKNKNKKP